MPIKNYTWRQKNKLLVWGALIFGLLVYTLAIQKTFSASARLRAVSVSAGQRQAIADELARLQAREAQLQGIFSGSEPIGYEPAQMAALAARSNVVLREIKRGGHLEQDGVDMVYTHYVFSAPFAPMVRLLDSIGQRKDIRPVHANFDRKTKPDDPAPELLLELVTVRISPHDNIEPTH